MKEARAPQTPAGTPRHRRGVGEPSVDAGGSQHHNSGRVGAKFVPEGGQTGVKLYAISDLHVGFKENRHALLSVRRRPEDFLILAGDVGETVEHLEFALSVVTRRFRQVIWVPGNHELWTVNGKSPHKGEAKYYQLVSLCRSYGVLTPEDPYPLVESGGRRYVIAPLFLLYDYSFRPDDVPFERALEWAQQAGIMCADEVFLFPDPYPSRQAWCAARCDMTEARLSAVPKDIPMVLVNHFPPRRDLVVLPRIPRFSIWCGTRRTEDWHRKFNVAAVVYGHTHVRARRWIDNTLFEEVSFGYPQQHRFSADVDPFLREILPVPERAG